MRYHEILEGSAQALGYSTPAFHGTSNDIEAFRIDGNKMSGAGSRESPLGVWFTDDPEAAGGFADWAWRGGYGGNAGKNVLPVMLRIRNPLVVKSYDDIRQFVNKHTTFERPGYFVGGSQIQMMGDKVDYQAARADLIAQGYDAIVLPNTMTDSATGKPITQYCILDPKDIRSRHAKFDNGDTDDLLA